MLKADYQDVKKNWVPWEERFLHGSGPVRHIFHDDSVVVNPEPIPLAERLRPVCDPLDPSKYYKLGRRGPAPKPIQQCTDAKGHVWRKKGTGKVLENMGVKPRAYCLRCKQSTVASLVGL
jgi:hypothetical protein